MTPSPRKDSDPVAALNRSTLEWGLAGLLFMIAVGVWAFRPLPRTPLVLEEPVAAADAPKLSKTVAFNVGAFDIPLWTPTPSTAAPVVAQKPAPPPLNLQLIGITRDTPTDGGAPVLRAALYDPDADKLLIVAAGEKITVKGSPGYIVASLTPDAIELTDGETTRKLSLKDDRKPGT